MLRTLKTLLLGFMPIEPRLLKCQALPWLCSVDDQYQNGAVVENGEPPIAIRELFTENRDTYNIFNCPAAGKNHPFSKSTNHAAG